MVIGIVSDTHGNLSNTRQAIRQLQAFPVEAVIHCGDIVSPEIVPLFTAWPTHFVFGNCDYELAGLRMTIQDCSQTCHERFGEISLSERRIAFLHGDDHRLLRETIGSGEYDLVCYGHTHVPEQHRDGSTLVLNPGALHRANPHTFAVVDLDTMQATEVTLS